ncbi:Crp/Fnr family transcriptional regulator [Sphingomonas sp.]|uniref:Crp/Fnr family transcriptional regulator n=1 Tax=Sphingomonas sp. TaxID=28214 RepID=UPI0017D001D0|nr:Crp/Fnr family transcriptional regulator [Sphingomonas sp.]MBA3512227.1 Crp/Fnr family transcriptional regulator [Sphingomonas sp.]
MTAFNTQQLNGSGLEPMVRKLEYRGKFSDADRAALLGLPHVVKTMENNHYIVRERDKTTHSCLMLAGFAVRHKIVAGGHRQIVAIHMKGEMVDLQNSLLGTADHSVQMLTAGKVALIPREEIVRIAFERPAIGQAMWLDTLVDGSIFREWIANVGRRDARTRIAHLFCEFGMRLQHAGLAEQTGYAMPMTQEQLGDATGLTSVHVNRTIKALEADDLITRSTPREIIIGDWKKLAAAGDFDSGYLHMREDDPVLA